MVGGVPCFRVVLKLAAKVAGRLFDVIDTNTRIYVYMFPAEDQATRIALCLSVLTWQRLCAIVPFPFFLASDRWPRVASSGELKREQGDMNSTDGQDRNPAEEVQHVASDLVDSTKEFAPSRLCWISKKRKQASKKEGPLSVPEP